MNLERILMRRRVAKRSRKLARKVREAEALVCAHTKSGRTWLRVMISSIYHQVYGIDPVLLVEGDNFQRHNAAVPNLHFGGYIVRNRSGTTLATFDEAKPIIFLVRDPGDTAASFYYHLKYRATELELARKGIDPKEIEALDLFRFMLAPHLGVPRVMATLREFREESERRPHSLVVRYEDMLADPLAVLSRVMSLIDGRAYPLDVLHGAVRSGSLAEMRRKERSGYYATNRLGSGSAHPESWKVRTGQRGGWRLELNASEVQAIDSLLADFEYEGVFSRTLGIFEPSERTDGIMRRPAQAGSG